MRSRPFSMASSSGYRRTRCSPTAPSLPRVNGQDERRARSEGVLRPPCGVARTEAGTPSREGIAEARTAQAATREPDLVALGHPRNCSRSGGQLPQTRKMDGRRQPPELLDITGRKMMLREEPRCEDGLGRVDVIERLGRPLKTKRAPSALATRMALRISPSREPKLNGSRARISRWLKSPRVIR